MGPLRASWAILGSLEAILAVLETSSSRLGSHLGHLGRLGGVLEASWSPSWPSWIGKGIDPGIFGIDLGRKNQHLSTTIGKSMSLTSSSLPGGRLGGIFGAS